MTEGLRPNSRRLLVAAWLGTSAAVLAGLAVGVLAAVATLFVFYILPWWGLVSVLALFTLGPAIAMWSQRTRYRLGFAAGLTVSWVMFTVAAFVTLRDPGMSSEQLSRAESELIATHTPTYYLGEDADGNDLDEIAPDNSFWYGETCDMGGEAECGPTITVRTLPVAHWDDSQPCQRRADVLGVPTAVLYDSGMPVLAVFTGRQRVSIGTYKDGLLDADRALVLARGLRPLQQSTPSTTLPPPLSWVLVYLSEACHAGPLGPWHPPQ
jgi:hypothetical protein